MRLGTLSDGEELFIYGYRSVNSRDEEYQSNQIGSLKINSLGEINAANNSIETCIHVVAEIRWFVILHEIVE